MSVYKDTFTAEERERHAADDLEGLGKPSLIICALIALGVGIATFAVSIITYFGIQGL